ncbi:MAG: hypothetical protein ACKVOM_05645 [Ferruginibacter sp.]
MKKLLLSSAVVFFLCSVSFAQAKKATATPKESIAAYQKNQTELEKRKLLEYHQTSQVAVTPQQEARLQAEKLKQQKMRQDLKNAEQVKEKSAASLVDPRAN